MIDTGKLIEEIRAAASNENPSLINWFEMRALALQAAEAMEQAKEAGKRAEPD